MKFVSQETNANARLTLAVPASSVGSGDPTIVFMEGSGNGAANNKSYLESYLPNSGYLRMYSYQGAGASSGADIWRIPDDQSTFDLNTTADENAFDYVCQTCGKHELEKFECCGEVLWQDDVALMTQVLRQEPDAMANLERQGVITNYPYNPETKEGGGLFTSATRMPWFLLSGMVQMNARIKELEARLLQEAK